MSTRTLLFLVLVTLAFLGGFFVASWSSINQSPPKGERLSPTEVRGVSIEFQGKEWPLNFKAQLRLLAFLDGAQQAQSKHMKAQGETPTFTSIIVHRFGNPDIRILPIHFSGDQLVFRQLEWEPNGYLVDQSHGLLREIIQSSYDH